MTFKQLYEIEQEWSGCVKCPKLSKTRDAQSQSLWFGSGYSDAIGLVITDLPYTGGKEETEEWEILKKIWAKTGIDERDWYVTGSLACPTKTPPTNDNITNCRDRVSEIMYSISPAVVVLAGYEGYISFFGKSVLGPNKASTYKETDHYHTYFTHGVSEYLRERTSDKARAQVIGAKMFADWQEIAKLMIKVKSK
jgi:uracil-DNA glycosylase